MLAFNLKILWSLVMWMKRKIFSREWARFTGSSRFRESPWRDERGQSMVEYALIIGLIAVVLVAALTALTGSAGVGGLVDTIAQLTGAL
jgi:Flp pilus assembly pilin Flp